MSTKVNRVILEAEVDGFAGQAVFIEGTPKEFVANLQIGPNQGQGFRLSVGDIRADKLLISSNSPDGNTGVTGAAFIEIAGVTDGLSERTIQYAVNVSTEEYATSAITVYNNAIVKVAQLRGELGAIQNRLEYTSANLDNTQENMTAALSRIEDTDMALEMSEYTKMNIMMQAGTSMLAQANQMPQMVLQLLG
ncbi:flagellin [Anoxynatronum sibiricum]|uniref:Flagellin n=2 Tax=Anoxynatronum sibiricum TaxID=210623 RepID=A0ABU9VXX3_9CLOT